MKTHTVWIGAGSNHGDRLHLLQQAAEQLTEAGITVIRTSSIYETEPVGFMAEQQFLNAVFECKTSLDPNGLLEELLQIETALGRKRSGLARYESRTMDLDLLFFEKEVINTHNLCVPHPLLHTRMFVLAPLNELIPHFEHPLLLRSVEQLYEQSVDQNPVVIYQKPFSAYQ